MTLDYPHITKSFDTITRISADTEHSTVSCDSLHTQDPRVKH